MGDQPGRYFGENGTMQTHYSIRQETTGMHTLRILVAAVLGAAAALLLAGCGGGGSQSGPSITRGTIVTNPSPMTYVGGTATVSAQVTDTTAVNASTVKVDVVDQNHQSLIGGPQVMTPVISPANTFTYQVTLANNLAGTSNKVYTATITAANTNGIATSPVTVGTIIVPFPPPPPAGP